MNRMLAISDIHGCFYEFKELLALVNYDSSKDRLILLGDYMDRGRYSKESVYFVKELVEEHGAVAIKGNHDQMFCDWLKDPVGHKARYIRNGGQETIKSLLDLATIENDEDETYQLFADKIAKEHGEVIKFLENLPYFYETDDFIFVHAGINPEHKDWKETSEHEMIWIRDPFLNVEHRFAQTFIHGHTPTVTINGQPNVHFGKNKIGIDGACVYGYQLNCLEIVDGEFKEYFVKGEKVCEDD